MLGPDASRNSMTDHPMEAMMGLLSMIGFSGYSAVVCASLVSANLNFLLIHGCERGLAKAAIMEILFMIFSFLLP